MSKLILIALSTVALAGVAAAQPSPDLAPPGGPPPPLPPNAGIRAPRASEPPDFVVIDRFDANSRAGIDLSYLEPNTKSIGTDPTLLRFEAHARYVDKPSGLGAYVQVPISYGKFSSLGLGTSSQTITDFGDLEAGAIFLPKLDVANITAVLHAGITAPTGEKGGTEFFIGVLDSPANLALLYNILPKAITAKLGVSPMIRQGNLFARLDLGLDWNLDAKNVVIGKAFHFNAGIGFDLGKASVMLESENMSITEQRHSPGTSSSATTLNIAAVSARFDAGAVLPYIAFILPLEEDTSDLIDFAITVGADFRLQ